MRHSSYLLVGAVISVVWCACGIFTSASPEAAPFPLNVDFPSFLARADPVYAWDSSFAGPTEWVDALFGGNGELGYLLWQPSPSSLRLDVSRQTVYDDRNSSLGPPRFKNNFVYDTPRLQVRIRSRRPQRLPRSSC